jgi:hypothetical protein
VAIIAAGASLSGSIFLYLNGAKKNEVDALRGIIQELKEYVNDLECDKEDLQVWAKRLVCQVQEAGLEPVEFIRSERKPLSRRSS